MTVYHINLCIAILPVPIVTEVIPLLESFGSEYGEIFCSRSQTEYFPRIAIPVMQYGYITGSSTAFKVQKDRLWRPERSKSVTRS